MGLLLGTCWGYWLSPTSKRPCHPRFGFRTPAHSLLPPASPVTPLSVFTQTSILSLSGQTPSSCETFFKSVLPPLLKDARTLQAGTTNLSRLQTQASLGSSSQGLRGKGRHWCCGRRDGRASTVNPLTRVWVAALFFTQTPPEYHFLSPLGPSSLPAYFSDRKSPCSYPSRPQPGAPGCEQ